jgi:hypothetical protein
MIPFPNGHRAGLTHDQHGEGAESDGAEGDNTIMTTATISMAQF